MLNIVYMGTPDFAVPPLKRLLAEGYPVSAVFSQPDRPRGRGQKLLPTEVKKIALQHDLPIHQPTNFKDGTVLSLLQELKPDLLVVVAYGRILPKAILQVPRLGAVNLHGSLLPAYRGAAPIQWSVINGDRETGITSMLMDEGMDTGDILLQDIVPIGETETAGELFDRLASLSADTLIKTIRELEAGTITPTPQNHALATYAGMITRDMGKLDFTKEPREVCNLIRGLNPWPKAFTTLKGERLTVLSAQVAPSFSGREGAGREGAGRAGAGRAGEILDPKELIVGCGDGAIKLLTVQPQGRQVMTGSSFANGRRLQGGEVFAPESCSDE